YIEENITKDITSEQLDSVIAILQKEDPGFDLHTLTSTSNLSTSPISLSIVHLAVECGNAPLIPSIVKKYGAHLLEFRKTERSRTPLVHAVVWDQCECVRILLDLSANVNVKCSNDSELPAFTPLWYAAEKTQNLIIVKLLARKGGKAEPALSEEGQKML